MPPPPSPRHRGSGASKVHGHNVRENTLLSFQKAALNHSEFIEFDVSWRAKVARYARHTCWHTDAN